MPLTLIINGEQQVLDQLDPGSTVEALLGAMQLKSDRIALELNGSIAARRDWGSITLADSDKLELVHFVGGGLIS